MLVNPLNLEREADHLVELGQPDIWSRLSIDGRAPIITPYHVAANRLREIARGGGRHGSCGQGIGETMSDLLEHGDEMLFAVDLLSPSTSHKKLELVRRIKLNQLEQILGQIRQDSPGAQDALDSLRDPGFSAWISREYTAIANQLRITDGSYLTELLADAQHAVFEGAQGVLLDEWYGFHPYTTWSTTTSANALTLLREAGFDGQITRLGLLRAYTTRHGPGPFVTEDARLTEAMPDQHNTNNVWQRGFRVGYFDAVVARYALEVNDGVDGLVITNLDRLHGQTDWQMGVAYRHNGAQRRSRLLGNGREIGRLPVSPQIDLGHQASLTHALMRCRPVYQRFQAGAFGSGDEDRYVRAIESELSVPVVLTSAGPTATDKHPR
jgi:adenylosuccinate synthase